MLSTSRIPAPQSRANPVHRLLNNDLDFDRRTGRKSVIHLLPDDLNQRVHYFACPNEVRHGGGLGVEVAEPVIIVPRREEANNIFEVIGTMVIKSKPHMLTLG